MQKIADSADWKMPAAIDDPEILTEITAAQQRADMRRRAA